MVVMFFFKSRIHNKNSYNTDDNDNHNKLCNKITSSVGGINVDLILYSREGYDLMCLLINLI